MKLLTGSKHLLVQRRAMRVVSQKALQLSNFSVAIGRDERKELNS
jgi:hypothetical protein